MKKQNNKAPFVHLARGGRGSGVSAATGGGLGKLLLILLPTLLLTSCLTVGRIQRNCDKFAALCVTEKETVVEYRDTTIFVDKPIEVPVPHFKDSVRIRDSVQIITVFDTATNQEIHYAEMDTTEQTFGLISARAWVTRSKIGMDAWLTDSTFLYNYQDSIKLENGVKDSDTTQTVTVRYIPKFYRFTFWFFIVAFAATGGWLLIRFKVGNLVDRLIKRR